MSSRKQTALFLSALRVFAGVALLALLLFLAKPGRLLSALRGSDPWIAAAAAVPFTAVLLLEAVRVAQLFGAYDLGYGTALRLTMAGMFLGSFTPGTLGGEAYKIYFLQRRIPGLARPIALTALLRLAGVGATLSLAAIYFAVYPRRLFLRGGDLLQVRWGVLGAMAALLLAAGLALMLGRRARAALLEAVRSLREVRPLQLAGLALVSLLLAAARLVYFYLLARSFAPDVFLPDLAPVAAAAALAGVVPVTVGGLGMQEGVLAAGLVLLSLPYPEAVAAALLNRGFLWAAAAVGWMAMVRREPAV